MKKLSGESTFGPRRGLWRGADMITENKLDEWVRGNSRDAQGLIVELIYRLVAVSSPRPKRRRFPLGDSIGQPGPDGELDTDLDFDPFVPEGISYWEIGTGEDAGKKATSHILAKHFIRSSFSFRLLSRCLRCSGVRPLSFFRHSPGGKRSALA